MMNTKTALRATVIALLLSTGSAYAQEACKSYTVKANDNLRKIARAAYGDADQYRVIYDANVSVIGAKADLIEIGQVLNLPCSTEAAAAAPAPAPAPSTDTAAAAAPEIVPIHLVTGSDYAPFTDESLPGGGIFTQLVEMAAFRADPEMAYDLTFINDWEAHIDALLPSKAYDLSFPWSRPNCDAPETLSPGDANRCENFLYSEPFYEIVDAYYATADSGLAEATKYDDFKGKRICRPEGYTTGVLDAAGLVAPAIELVRPSQVDDCFGALSRNEVDLVALDADVAQSAIARLKLDGKILQNQQLTSVTTLHVIAHKSNDKAVATIGLLNDGLKEMYDSGEWYDIVSHALSETMEQPTN